MKGTWMGSIKKKNYLQMKTSEAFFFDLIYWKFVKK